MIICFPIVREFPSFHCSEGTMELGSNFVGLAASLCTKLPMEGEKWKQGEHQKFYFPGIFNRLCEVGAVLQKLLLLVD